MFNKTKKIFAKFLVLFTLFVLLIPQIISIGEDLSEDFTEYELIKDEHEELLKLDDQDITTPSDQFQLKAEDKYYIAKVVNILEESNDGLLYFQKVVLEIEGDGSLITYDNYMDQFEYKTYSLNTGDKIILRETFPYYADEPEIVYFERLRSPALIVILIVFVGIIVIFAREKGIMSIAGLLFTLYVIVGYVIPEIIRGTDPFLVCILGTFFAGPISIFLAHGINKRTTVAVISTVLVMIAAVFLATVFVDYAGLTGIGSDGAFLLQVEMSQISMKGLLLGGMIFGILGILDDITTAQTAAVDELRKANRELNYVELYKRGISIGREHMSSMVNTLVLAYTGASFPLLLILVSPINSTPLWVQLNAPVFAEEIIRTLTGSIVLIMAVPVTTAIAAFFMSRKTILDRIFKEKHNGKNEQVHTHTHTH